ncbi:MAG: MBL fold metallo-hydrolase [Syntrophales bacterium]|jgi:metallo-beta-lactamase family protein|nr:MBL fold metallo-hydrolase [Syntrophales bacterium]MDY0043487.1 MBL fold metallo-hydrolase [Syntrophales bacterium]
MVNITCLGAAGSVTGSNYLIETKPGRKILVDCGLFQGGRQIEKRNWEKWGFDPSGIETMLLTHAHIDHSGRIPKLVKDGFKGKIIASHPTSELCEIMLLDSAHIQEMDAEWQSRKNIREGKKAVYPLYETGDARESLRYLAPTECDRIIPLEDGIKARLRDAGHILGSCIIELWIEDENREIKVVFSGDLGNKNQLIVNDPHDILDADYVFMESTYGNRLHRSFEDSKAELLEAIKYSCSKDEKIIIPAFALERTQEVLYLLGEFSREGLLPEIPVYLDSPLAIKATEIFRRHKDYYDKEARLIVQNGFDPFNMPNLILTPSTEESIAINKKSGSAIIIAASGMMNAGRIKHHLKHNLWRPGASIVIVGYQAEGTTGRKIVEGATHVKVFKEDVAVRAKVFTIGGFSAHADQKGLMEWIGNFKSSRPKVFLVHGEAMASQALSQKIAQEEGFETHIPQWKECVSIKAPTETVISMAAEDGLEKTEEEFLAALGKVEQELEALRAKLSKKRTKEAPGEHETEKLREIADDLRSLNI